MQTSYVKSILNFKNTIDPHFCFPLYAAPDLKGLK